ncbi:terminase small subunit [Bacillus phage W.Ph.]|uniref:Gp5 n=1 Tax=Bacillus phage W.Ph. TaxID=764595 RepID=G9B1A6_9CAUD|nr:terminase small subunit [Bacillus phage W.Ph.]ADH03151.1 gp5 [Bacillus phage W.Ph.]
MAMVNNIKRNLKTKSNAFDAQEELRQSLNLGFSELMLQFANRVQNGDIKIDNVADAVRVMGVFKELNGIDEVMAGQGASGMLPELNMRQEKVMDDLATSGVVVKEENDNGDETLDISNITDDDVAQMLQNMDIAQNSENEEQS